MNVVIVFGTAAAVAAATLAGAVHLFGRRPRSAALETEADAPEPRLDVLVRRRVGFGRSLVVVEVEGRRFLLGSTHKTWTALADLGRRSAGPDGTVEATDVIEAELNRALNASRFRRGGSSR